MQVALTDQPCPEHTSTVVPGWEQCVDSMGDVAAAGANTCVPLTQAAMPRVFKGAKAGMHWGSMGASLVTAMMGNHAWIESAEDVKSTPDQAT